ncbi:hypothetical protein TPHA_0H00710 [Tetrapisispora phaffii CBS 4417]|uniref:Trehalase n=1 Tax=Tetrapisispora phaffii (strain ATCC 24235 / CBS 4417 / NBRC 1672 / NRRL Y-8282 / UCD 70-5) TaxID=1071381 RepID=G8BWX7_TETPH|nr:hypothetical protein TPHA_0H00710 [Tetrapisispora phaffii CBS 4417]CCE64281.1 hypothetical protein TPHA_0H00710 [Tetrapisispora phaffii CBS 4417]
MSEIGSRLPTFEINKETDTDSDNKDNSGLDPKSNTTVNIEKKNGTSEGHHIDGFETIDNTLPKYHRRRLSSLNEFHDPFSNAEIYYGPEVDPSKLKNTGNTTFNDGNILQSPLGRVSTAKRFATNPKFNRTRTMSVIDNVSHFKTNLDRYSFGQQHKEPATINTTEDVSDQVKPQHEVEKTTHLLQRRGSEDDIIISSQGNRRFFIEDVDRTLHELLQNEDTDANCQITIEDTGPKVLKVGSANSFGFQKISIRGTYMLSNLLQELTIAKSFGRSQIYLDEARINENPVNRLSRLIEHQFWNSLTRHIDLHTIGKIAQDSKVQTKNVKSNPRIYVPYNNEDQYEFFLQASQMDPSLKLEVEYLPKHITPTYVKSLNDTPGLLSLAMEKHFDPSTGEMTLSGYPYAVPGGRFNELYGWDSYLMALGLVENGKVDVAKGMVEHFIFEIDNYGKILNANRSYYLCRSQPPFLTDMALIVFNKIGGENNPQAINFLRRAFKAAIKEYKNVWTASPRYDEETGLSCYHPDGEGIPPETEPGHFNTILAPYAAKYNVTIEEFRSLYNDKKVKEPALDEFFLHDRGVRESGHDTTYRFEGVCAYLATIDLNALLYKYETDIAKVIEKYFDDSYFDPSDNTDSSSSYWRQRARKRKATIEEKLWDEEKGFYFDYNIKLKQRTTFESATTFWALWAGLATPEKAQRMVEKALPKLEVLGGLVASSEESRGPLSVDRPSRQWDYPYGWAPHQIFAWEGLTKYGYRGISTRLSYRWLYMMTKAFVDYNGIVVEKYDVTRGIDPHKVDAEYGNQGADFKGVATEGFGWVNSSYILGLKYMNNYARRALGACIAPSSFFKRLKDSEKKLYSLK